MKANELRIGNFILLGGNSFGTVVNITTETDEEPQVDFITIKIGGGYIDSTINGFYPIKLTEEWLVRFGFEGKESDGFCIPIEIELGELQYEKYLALEGSIDGFYCDLVYKEDTIEEIRMILKDIGYVHQLQNLYFALTGEELTLKIPIN